MSLSFSVVIPLHNKRPHVLRALHSALAQPEACEVLVIDDASNDGGMAEVGKVAAAEPRIVTLSRSEPGPGGYAARNLGARRASAPWVAFLDADDEWLPGHLAGLAALAERHPGAAILASAFLDQRPQAPPRPDKHARRYAALGAHLISPTEYLSRSARGLCPVWTSAMAVRTADLLGVGGFPEGRAIRGGDQETWLRLVLAGAQVAWDPHPSAVYHRDATNMVTVGTAPQLERNCIWQTIAAELRQPRQQPRLLRRLSNRKMAEAMVHRLRRGELRFRDLAWLYPVSDPGLAILLAASCLIPRPLCRFLP